MKRSEILDTAKEYVCQDRETDYGSPEDSFQAIAQYWSHYLGYSVTAHDVAIMMALLKIARIQTGRFKADSYIDAAGYLACAGEIGDDG
jgi:hypothetical protein